MIVAIQKGLGNLKAQLSALGFDMVDYGDYKYPVDAVVYKGLTAQLINTTHVYFPCEVFFVDCSGMPADEIATILHRRLYTPLF